LRDGTLYIPATGGVVLVDTSTGAITGPLAGEVGSEVISIAFTDDGVWLLRRDLDSERIERWDPALSAREVLVDIGGEQSFTIAGHGDSLYLATDHDGLHVYSSDGRLVRTMRAEWSSDLEIDENGTLWMGDVNTGELVSVDTATNTETSRFRVTDGEIVSIEVSPDGIWFTTRGTASLGVVDPSTQRVTASVHLVNDPESLTVDGGAAWIAGSGGWGLRFVGE
jgi:hypothetical protein